jgi:hypothetical protein
MLDHLHRSLDIREERGDSLALAFTGGGIMLIRHGRGLARSRFRSTRFRIE